MDIIINVLAVIGLIAIIGTGWAIYRVTREPKTYGAQKPWAGPEYEYRPKK